MAWPKGRKRAKVEKQAKAELESAVQVEAVQSLRDLGVDIPVTKEEPPAELTREQANRQMMLHYVRGEYIPEDLRLHWDMRSAPIVKRVRIAMLKDRATMDQAEAYLDDELARR